MKPEKPALAAEPEKPEKKFPLPDNAVKFPDVKPLCFPHTRGKCTAGKDCQFSHNVGKASKEMLRRRNKFEEEHGGKEEAYKVWPHPRKAGAPSREVGERKKLPLEKDKDGKVKPKNIVGCNFLATGKDCNKGDSCEFSHKAEHVAERKKFLARINKRDSDPKKDPKKKKVAAAAAGTDDDDEDIDDDEQKVGYSEEGWCESCEDEEEESEEDAESSDSGSTVE